MGLYEQTKIKATKAGVDDFDRGVATNPKARKGSAWDEWYMSGYNKNIADGQALFESPSTNPVPSSSGMPS